MGVTRVVLYIDRMTLRGFDRPRGVVFSAAFRHELARALAEPGVARGLAAQPDTPRLRASLPASNHMPREAASAVARALAGLPK